MNLNELFPLNDIFVRENVVDATNLVKSINEDRHPSAEYLEYAEKELALDSESWIRAGIISLLEYIRKGGDRDIAIALVNKHKDKIIRIILSSVRDRLYKYAKNSVIDLRKIGVNWDELDVVEKSVKKLLKEDDYDDEDDDEISRNYEALASALHRNDPMIVSDRISVLLDYEYYDQPFEDVVEFLASNLKSLIGNKEELIRMCLVMIKDENYDAANAFVTAIRTYNVNWPELDIIQKSLKADKQIDEDMENDDQTMRNFVLGSVKTNLKSGNIGAALNVIQADLKITDIKPEAKVAWFKHHVSPLLNRNKPKILKWFAAAIDAVTMPRIASAYKLLNLLGVEIPDLLDLLNSQKDHVVKRLLQVVKNHASTDPVIKDVRLLKELGIKWPELEIIERSANALMHNK